MTKRKKEEEVAIVVRTVDPMAPELKHTIRKMIRGAIAWQNKQALFTCEQCCFYQPTVLGKEIVLEDEDEDAEPTYEKPILEHCTLELTNKLVKSKRMPHQLPECFIHNPLDSAFAGVLDLMHSLDIYFHEAKHGWATVVGRLAKRMDRYGYIAGVKQKNLERYK